MNRKEFLKTSISVVGLSAIGIPALADVLSLKKRNLIGAQVWVYAKHQPGFDVSPILPQIFSDMKYAGIEGIETMQHPLRKESTTKIIRELIDQYQLPLIGTSYGAAFWDKSKHNEILEDVEKIMDNMATVDGHTFGITVGHPSGRNKTEKEFDDQADLLGKIMALGRKNNIVPNLHNHIPEVENDLFEIKNILKRTPHFGLGPDLEWLLQAGVDPLDFLKKYRKNIVFLHLRDQLANKQWAESIGEGIVDFKEIADTLKDIDFEGEIILELAHNDGFVPTRPIKESMKMSREWICKAMGN